MATFKNSSSSENIFQWNWSLPPGPKIGKRPGVVFSIHFLGWQASYFYFTFFSFLEWEVKRTHSWNGFLTMVICTKKTEISFTVFTWSGSSKERDRKKLKFLMNWRWEEAFSPLSVLRLYLISSMKTKKYVFSESKLVLLVPKIPRSAPEVGRLALVIIWFRVQVRLTQYE